MNSFLKKSKKYGVLSLIFFFLFMFLDFSQVVLAQQTNEVDLLFFYGKGCPHCSKAEIFLDDIASQYPSLIVSEYEIYFDQNNNQIFQDLAEAFNTEIEGVPTMFIDDKIIAGFSDAIGNSLEQEISNRIRHNPMISLHCEYDFEFERNDFINKDITIYLISDNNEETIKFIKDHDFEITYIQRMPSNYKHILGNYGRSVKALEMGTL